MNQMCRRIVMAFVGVFLCGVSVSLFRVADLGSDPFTVGTLAVATLFHSTYGTVYPFFIGALLLICFFFDHSRVGVATFINLFLTGFVVDFFFGLIDGFAILHTMPGRIALMLFAFLLTCVAASLYFTANLGVSGYDAVSQVIAEKRHWPFRACRIGTDSVCVLFGLVTGVTVGVATVLTALCMGPLIQFLNDHMAGPLLRAGTKDSAKA